MAANFVIASTGDQYNFGWNLVTKKAAAAYSAPAIGDLVALGTGTANEVVAPADEVLPYGIVEWVSPDSKTLTVAELVAGATIELPYTGSAALGNAVECAGSTQGTSLLRTVVACSGDADAGNVIAVDADAPHGTGHVVVRFK